MNFDDVERATLAGLADVLIPAGDGFPSASQAGAAGDGLDQVLSVRPDLAAGLKKLLAAARGLSAAQFVVELEKHDPTNFSLLAELVPSAYFLNPQVRARLHYDGQGPHLIDPRPDYLDDGLLQAVIDRGPIYRATPRHRD